MRFLGRNANAWLVFRHAAGRAPLARASVPARLAGPRTEYTSNTKRKMVQQRADDNLYRTWLMIDSNHRIWPGPTT